MKGDWTVCRFCGKYVRLTSFGRLRPHKRALSPNVARRAIARPMCEGPSVMYRQETAALARAGQ